MKKPEPPQFNCRIGDTVLCRNGKQVEEWEIIKVSVLNEHQYPLDFKARNRKNGAVKQFSPFTEGIVIVPPEGEVPDLKLPVHIGVCRATGCARFAYHLFVRKTLEVVQLVDQSISWIPIRFEVDEDEALWSCGKEQADNTGECFRAGKQIVRLPAALAKEIKGQISP